MECAVAEGAGRAPDLHALRNAIGDLLESVELIDLRGSNPFGSGMVTGGFVPGDRPDAGLEDASGPRYALLPRVRWLSVDTGTLSPIGQLTPVPPRPQ